MDEVRVNTAELVEILKKNREKHRAIFEEAIEGYRKRVIEHLDYALECAKSGKKIITHLVLVRPTDHTLDYDHAIGMLEMSVDDSVVIDYREYRQYVCDEWTWSSQFSSSSSSYSSHSSSSRQELEEMYLEEKYPG